MDCVEMWYGVPRSLWISVALGTSFAFTLGYHWLITLSINLLSKVLGFYLNQTYPIKDISLKRDLPSLPYRWPDGNGDIAKFLNGPQNSRKWRKEYGKVYRIWAGSSPEVVVSDSEHLKTIFRDSDLHTKAINNDSGYLMSQVLGQCVGLLSGRVWQHVRRKTERPFSHHSINDSAPTVRMETQKYVQTLLSSENVQMKSRFDPVRDIKLYPFLVTATILYGKLDDGFAIWLKRLVPLREELFSHVIKGGLSRFPISRYLPTRANKLLRAFQKDWLRFNKEICQLRKVAMDRGPAISWWEDAFNGGINQIQLLQTLDEALFANLDVTTGAISWNFLYLAANTQEQSLLRSEILEQADDGDDRWDKYIERSDTFLAACINESARLRPVTAFSIPQAPPTDRIIDNWVIPKNTMIIVDTYGLNVCNEFWGKDSQNYRPSRFLGLSTVQTRYQMWRFGFGPRQCMGKFLAEYLVRSIVASVIKELEINLSEADKQKMDFSHNPNEWVTQPDITLECRRR